VLKLSQPHISEEAIAAVGDVLRSGQLVHGAECESFEKELATYLGCDNVLVVSSATAALHIALLVLNIGPGDAVIVPDFTFPATANVVALTGARVVVVDVNLGEYTINTQLLNETIRNWAGPERLRAIIPVHEFGCVADMTSICRLAEMYNLAVIEDAACALGAKRSGRKAGTIGDIGCFSFHPRKTLTTGEGGAIATNNTALAKRMRRLRNHGMDRTEDGMRFFEPATNYRMTNFQAALGRKQLPMLDAWIDQRQQLAKLYMRALEPLVEDGRISCPLWDDGHSWQSFMVTLTDEVNRKSLITLLQQRGVEANLGAQSLSQIGIYKGVTALAEHGSYLYRSGLVLPMFEMMTAADVHKVTRALADSIAQLRRT
jgi:dTDP-4-amino-4,6-dideoxygalactose transaminase